MTSSSPSELPPEVAKAIEAAKSAKRLQDCADTLKAQAALIQDPAERERLWQAAYDKEVQAHGQSKMARLLASGWAQGAAGGIGASGALGMGLGNLVGVLVSGVVAIPGALVGAGIGALHGPWYKLSLPTIGGGKDDAQAGSSPSDEEAHRAVIEAARQAEEEEEGTKSDSEAEK